ncbi:DUF2075 domain-containing protein [Nocardia salmonicida]|uniref:DUF2075 domain-containing protein n=1 Tax=Nocardia salmonicida TaxID=53431 RepID=UPI00340862A1
MSEAIAEHRLKYASQAERRSWDASLPMLAKVLVDAGLGEIDMLIEYPMPQSSRRADAVLAGADPRSGRARYVVVELKQWSQADLGWNSDQIVWSINTRGDQLHPIDQVRGYCRYLQQYVSELHDEPESVSGIAYLHNATRESVSGLLERPPDRLGRLFTGDQNEDLADYFHERLSPDSGAADRLRDSEILRRKAFLDFTEAELRKATEYSLLDNQKLAFEAVLNRIDRSRRGNHKSVVLVTGGPGSGKSMVAISALAELERKGYDVAYATGSTAVTTTMRTLSAKRGKELNALFTYYARFAEREQNSIDVLICDEAHRIRRTSTDRWTKRKLRTDRPQVDELMAAARVPVFLLDENQVVRPDEVGTVDLIRDHAARMGFPVFHIRLDGQFRCGGSAAYDEWVLNLLGLRAGSFPTPWKGTDFSVRVVSSPQEMENFLRDRIAEGASARMTAGYCWTWSAPRPDGSLVDDVEIGTWARPWNMVNDGQSAVAPPASLWAADPRGFGQIGCIYTAQGFEYDWGGVILGPDIGVHNERIVVRREGNKDKALVGTRAKPVFDEEFDMLIRNTYRVLLTRAMHGVVIYAVDPAVRELLGQLVPAVGDIPDPGRRTESSMA